MYVIWNLNKWTKAQLNITQNTKTYSKYAFNLKKNQFDKLIITNNEWFIRH